MLKEVRKNIGMSQGQLAEKSGISVRMIQNYEQGARDINGVKLLTLIKLSEALDCKIFEIVTDPELITKLKKLSI